jgi:two-component system chemotaxis response regulator CheY
MTTNTWKILVVDDDFFNRKLIGGLLTACAECDFAVNGREALLAFDAAESCQVPYDAVLIDYNMPELDGIELIDEIRRREGEKGIDFEKGIPIIMITAHAEVFMEAFKKGASDYLLKPVHRDSLMGKLEALLVREKT